MEAEGKEEQPAAAPSELLKYQTWILKVSIHCKACKRKVMKVLHSIDGVYTTEVDARRHKVTVVGNVDGQTLIRKLLKSGKHAELWPEPAAKPQKEAEEERVREINSKSIANGGERGSEKEPAAGGGATSAVDQQLAGENTTEPSPTPALASKGSGTGKPPSAAEGDAPEGSPSAVEGGAPEADGGANAGSSPSPPEVKQAAGGAAEAEEKTGGGKKKGEEKKKKAAAESGDVEKEIWIKDSGKTGGGGAVRRGLQPQPPQPADSGEAGGGAVARGLQPHLWMQPQPPHPADSGEAGGGAVARGLQPHLWKQPQPPQPVYAASYSTAHPTTSYGVAYYAAAPVDPREDYYYHYYNNNSNVYSLQQQQGDPTTDRYPPPPGVILPPYDDGSPYEVTGDEDSHGCHVM